jgi:NTP pyrophosphatase (non-canonical NTP hydrolase)
MDFASITDRALVIRALYDDHERRNYGRRWSTEELTLGLVGDVGDLAKLVQAQAGVRAIDDVDAKLGHELADILWSIIVIAERCNVDLASSFAAKMDENRGGADNAAVVACSHRSPGVRECHPTALGVCRGALVTVVAYPKRQA